MAPRRKIEDDVQITTRRCSDPPPPELIDGIQLYNKGEFFECHEVLELIWRAESDPVRELYHGLLQVGVSFHHQGRGNYHGAVTLLARGLRRLGRLPPICMNIDVASLRVGGEMCLHEFRRLGPERIVEFNRSLVPLVRFVGGSRRPGLSSDPTP
jgi:uncharacterized protein